MSEQPPIKILIVDDHPVLRHGLRTMLSTFDDFIVAGEAGNGLEALSRCEETNPDVILMDVVMPGMDGVETTRSVLKRYPHVRIIVLTSFPKQSVIEETMEAGAIGFLLKDAPIDTLGDAIRSAYAGHATLAPEAIQVLMKGKTRPPELGHDLSTREREVLALIVEGFSNDEIADRLVISVNTVRKHVSACMLKLEASNRAQVAATAVRHQIIS